MSKLSENTWVPISMALGAVVFAASAWGFVAVMNFQVAQHADALKSIAADVKIIAENQSIEKTDIAVIKTEMKGLRIGVKRQHAEEVAFHLGVPHSFCQSVFRNGLVRSE
jgi:hypothetical protein